MITLYDLFSTTTTHSPPSLCCPMSTALELLWTQAARPIYDQNLGNRHIPPS